MIDLMKDAFMVKYQRDWDDPASAEMQAVWADAWEASLRMKIQNVEQAVKAHVELAMAHRFRLVLADERTGQPFGANERQEFLNRAFVEIAKGMGVDRFLETPAERLDQFAVMSVIKNHDTAGLLRSLVNSFMIAYACPETADRAFMALVQIEGLRAEVADTKGQGRMSNNPNLVAAANELDERLRQAVGQHHTPQSPIYKVMIGADRIYVRSAFPLTDVPTEIGGFPVETMVAVGAAPSLH